MPNLSEASVYTYFVAKEGILTYFWNLFATQLRDDGGHVFNIIYKATGAIWVHTNRQSKFSQEGTSKPLSTLKNP